MRRVARARSGWRSARMALVTGAALFGVPASAHDTYILPKQFRSAEFSLDLPLTSAETFPALEFGPKRARISSMLVRGTSGSSDLTVVQEGAKALLLRLTAAREGFYAVGVAFSPHPIALTSAQVSEYFAEIGASDAIRQAYAALPAESIWKEVYTKYSKAFVCIRTCDGEASLSKPLGLDLEFVRAKQQSADGTITFQLLRRGTPVTNQPVAVKDSVMPRRLVTTNAQGMIHLSGLADGPVLLSAVMIDTPAKPGAPFISAFATLTFDAMQASPRMPYKDVP